MDVLEDEESDKVEVRGYCSVDNLLDFRMDPPARAKESQPFAHYGCLARGSHGA